MATLIDEEIPTPEAIPQGFYASEPALPGGTMNAQVLPQVYGTASDNAYLSEQRALAGLDPRSRRQEALLKAEMEEQATRTAGQLGYQWDYESLRKGGANEQEAAVRAYYANAGKLNWNHPDKLALGVEHLSLPVDASKPIIATPVTDQATGKPVSNAIIVGGKYRATAPVSGAAEEKAAAITAAAIEKERREQIAAQLRPLYRSAADPLGMANTNTVPRIQQLESQLEGMRSKATGAPKAESDKTVIKYDKSGKAWRVDPETKKVIGPA